MTITLIDQVVEAVDGRYFIIYADLNEQGELIDLYAEEVKESQNVESKSYS